MERFKVSTIEGYNSEIRAGGYVKPGLSAHVLDTAHCHNVVAVFRSEDRVADGRPRGRERAIREAEFVADAYNRTE